MKDLVSLFKDADLIIQILVTVIGTVLSVVIIDNAKKIFQRFKISEEDIKTTQDQFTSINKVWISGNRKKVSKKAYEMSLELIDDHEMLSKEATPLIAKKEWIPENPVPIQNVNSKLVENSEPEIKPRVDILPFIDHKNRFGEYNHAVKELLKPALFTSNRQYRLMNISTSEKSVTLSISSSMAFKYFDKIDYGKTAELEFTQSILNKNGIKANATRGSFKKLPNKRIQKFRKNQLEAVLSDDFSKTVLLSGVNTLTLIKTKTGSYRFLMHIRSKKQAYAEGTRHVVPAGEFQPLSAGNNFDADTNILFNILREYAEEIGGYEEFHGEESREFDYTSTPPFSEYLKAFKRGDFRVFYLGFGLDPLSLQGEHMTCAIFEEDTFNALFGTEVNSGNDEGDIVTDSNIWGIELNDDNVTEQYRNNILSAGEATLRLAYSHLKYFDSN